MDEELEQDAVEDIEDSQADENEHSNDGVEDAPETFKVGDVEYTADQVKDFEKKAKDYEALLPDYTRKSQKLAEIDKQGQETSHKSRFSDPNYKPKDYQEFYQDVKNEIEAEKARETEARNQETQKVKDQVDSFMAEIKSKDPNFNQKDFSAYAAKPGFRVDTLDDLKAVYERYQELNEAKKLGEESGRKGRHERADRVATGKSGESKVDFSDIRTSGGGTLDKAMEAFNRLN